MTNLIPAAQNRPGNDPIFALNAEAQRKGTSWSGGGVVTPGAVVGDALVGRLARSANVRFYSTTAATWKSDEMQAVDA